MLQYLGNGNGQGYEARMGYGSGYAKSIQDVAITVTDTSIVPVAS
mgnify:FL=1